MTHGMLSSLGTAGQKSQRDASRRNSRSGSPEQWQDSRDLRAGWHRDNWAWWSLMSPGYLNMEGPWVQLRWGGEGGSWVMPAGVAIAHLCSMGGWEEKAKMRRLSHQKMLRSSRSSSVIHDILLSFPEVAGRLMSVPLMGWEGLQRLVQHNGNLPRQTVSTAGTWSALHCSAGSSQQLLP